MKYYGVVYDVGLRFSDEGLSVATFAPELVEHDMRVIANELHANAVRIEGEEIDRLVTSTRAAHRLGLTVFFNPWKMNVGIDETRAYLAEAAVAAEELRNEGIDLVFVAGCEYTIFSKGIFPGDTLNDRLGWFINNLTGPPDNPSDLPEAIAEKMPLLRDALGSFVEVIRSCYGGPLTYSAGSWEDVDWSIFDMVGVDYYRQEQSDEEYVAGLDLYRRSGRPIGVLEVGCCAYEGAAVRGGGGFAILQGVDADGNGMFEGGVVPTRSEREQAEYVGQQLQLLAGAGVDAVFVYVFSFPSYRTGDGAKDLDMVSFSLVKTFPADDPRSQSMPPWEPKEAFHRAAEFFQNHAVAAVPAG